MNAAPHRVELSIAGTTCSFETGRIARLATGAVVGRCGANLVLATVVAGGTRGSDFFPLTVEYREKMAAAGRIPGSFARREGRITDHEVLVSRLIDRSVRSLFPANYRDEVQVQVQVMSAEPSSDLTSLALLSGCAALHVAQVPFHGPAAGLRIVRHRQQWLAFAGEQQRQDAELDLVVSHGPDGLVMVEGEAAEASEADCLAALVQAAEWLGRAQRAFAELRRATGLAEVPPPAATSLPPLPEAVRRALEAALAHTEKTPRRAAVAAVESAHLETVAEADRPAHAKALAELRWQMVRDRLLDTGRRLDGRNAETVRPIDGEVGWLPRAHGSAVFSRGETQAVVSVTLGTGDDAQKVDGLGGVRTEHFLLHYNFPPYSVNEPKPLRGPGRREIGHGHLARRGLARVLPAFADFPYTIRVEAEITESNGSSSMATVCGGCLALMDAGVPLARPVAGIAMGMISDGQRTAILTDILGDEDHLGDMDFKVVGTAEGITALQLDNKIGGLQPEQLAAALTQARTARLQVIAAMAGVLAEPRPETAPHAPRVLRTAILPASIGALVGPRGANVKALQQATGARIAIEDDGQVLVYAADAGAARRALQMVQRTAGVLRVGRYYQGTVTSVRDFGAFVRINDVNEGLVPAEELGDGSRRPGDVVEEGEPVVVLVLGTDGRGRLRLSQRRAAGVGSDRLEF